MKNLLFLPNRANLPRACRDVVSLVALVCSIECLLTSCQLLDSNNSKSIAQNEIPRSLLASHHKQAPNSASNKSYVDVENLHLISDYRSVRLRWTYAADRPPQPGRTGPTAFRIRYCELTSWQTEIKCRQRNLRVTSGELTSQHNDATQQQQQLYKDNNANQNSSVIAPSEADGGGGGGKHRRPILASEPTVRQLEPPNGIDYETQIYDLRALTNYTFQVQALAEDGRLRSGNNYDNSPPLDAASPSPANQRSQPMARSLSFEFGPADRRADEQRQLGPSNKLPTFAHQAKSDGAGRVETKAFGAEAAKCLANVSEITIQTGKYFGGRISVESSAEPKCQLLGNKSSEQSVYLLRVDHELCGSKVVDGNRIETMVLVHENKDILTHNSARFLVVCNFNHKSFTVKASVSLPKVNSLAAPNSTPNSLTRPATITRLKTGAGGSQLRVGTMPVVYHPNQPPVSGNQREATLTTSADDNDYRQSTARQQLADDSLTAAASTLHVQQVHPPSGLSPTGAQDANYTSTGQGQRRAKQLADAATAELLSPSPSRVSGSVQQVLLPSPVEVASKSLLFEPESSRGARLLELPSSAASHNHQAAKQFIVVAARSGHTEPRRTAVDFDLLSARTVSSQHQPGDSSAAESLAEPLILTNNHRVAENFPVLAAHNHQQQRSTAKPEAHSMTTQSPSNTRTVILENEPADYSIKYSPSEVSEYSLGKLDDLTGNKTKPPAGRVQSPTSQLRSRSGRVLHDSADSQKSSSFIVDGATLARRLHQNHNLEQRMGDQAANDLVVAESRQALDHDRPMAVEGTKSASKSQMGVQQSSETTTTLSNELVPKLNGQTLAQNITGALLRWSVRTLENWAKKSLESMAMDESDDEGNSTSPEQPTAGGDLNSARKVAREEDAASPTTTGPLELASDARKGSLPAPNQSTRPMQTTTRSSHRPAKLDLDSQLAANEHDLNGFIVHQKAIGRQSFGEPMQTRIASSEQRATLRPDQAATKRSGQNQRNHRLIEANSSKSDDSMIRRQDNPLARAQKSGPLPDASATSGEDDSLSWTFLVAVSSSMALVSAICVITYLSSVRFKMAVSSLVCKTTTSQPGGPALSRHHYLDTNSHLPPPPDELGRHRVESKLSPFPGSPMIPSHYSDSSCQTPRSTITTASLLNSTGSQSNRRTNEFIFTDHVLLGQSNESFA